MADAGEKRLTIWYPLNVLIAFILLIYSRILQRHFSRPGQTFFRQGAQAPQEHEIPP
jgi:hypothetical protein